MHLSLGLLDRPGREGQAQAHQARPGLAVSVGSRDVRTSLVSRLVEIGLSFCLTCSGVALIFVYIKQQHTPEDIMGITVSQINSAISTATQQTSTVTGVGEDSSQSIEIRSYRFRAMYWDLDRQDKAQTVKLLQEDTGLDAHGYYVNGKMVDGAEIRFGQLYKSADELQLCGEVGDSVMVGHIRKIAGAWKFRSGHDCRQYRGNLYSSNQACGFQLKNGKRCGAYGDIWKD